MRRTPVIFVTLATLAAALADTPSLSSQVVDTATVKPVQVITRERANGDVSLLMLIRQQPAPFDEVRVTLPSDKRASAGSLPDGWTHQQKGKQLRVSGPSTTGTHMRFDFPNSKLSDWLNKTTTLQPFSNGTGGIQSMAVITGAPKVEATPNLEGILTIVPYGSLGQLLTVGVANEYREGRWRFVLNNGSTWPLVPPRDVSTWKEPSEAIQRLRLERHIDWLLSHPDPLPFVTTVPEVPISRVTFNDPYGESLVDSALKLGLETLKACPLKITGGSEFAFAGQAACVSGCFPDLPSAYGLKLNGTQDLTPWSVSQTNVMIGIPPDTPPGSYTIGAPGLADTVTVGVLALQGSIDTNSLWRGQSTTMRLKIVGTDKPLPIVVLNRTPGIISVEGGVHQTLTTPGGADNAVTRNVRGIHRGDFQITYSLSTPGCGVPPDR